MMDSGTSASSLAQNAAEKLRHVSTDAPDNYPADDGTLTIFMDMTY